MGDKHSQLPSKKGNNKHITMRLDRQHAYTEDIIVLLVTVFADPCTPAVHFLLYKWENSRSSLCTLCRSQAEGTSAVLSPGAGHTASKRMHIWLQEVVAYKQSDIFPVQESMQISYNSTVSMLSYGRGLDRLTQANFAEWLRYLPFQNNVPLS